MILSVYNIIYLFGNVFGTYTIYKFMKVFFDKERTSRTTEIFSYFCYNIAISLIYMFINIPIVLMISNILAFFLLSWNYVSSFKLRILAALFIYLILMCIEMAIVIMTGYLKFPVLEQNDYSSVYGILSMKLVSFAVALIINNFKNIRKGKNVPNFYWANCTDTGGIIVYHSSFVLLKRTSLPLAGHQHNFNIANQLFNLLFV